MMKTALFTLFALLAFAGNSVLCRMALGENTIDAASFTIIRLLSGMIVLAILLGLRRSENLSLPAGSWKASFYLFLYAITFSFAYISLETGIGALILFGAVQITMILSGLLSGYKPSRLEWLGVLVAFSGFVYLVTPGVAMPSLTGFLLMTIAGISWAFYTLAGKGSQNPLADTSYNFLRTLPAVFILAAWMYQDLSFTTNGIVLAVLSGGITSGLGYTIWYIALGGLSTVQSAIVQLLVPVIAAIGGLVFSDEPISVRLVISSAMILGGILAVILSKPKLKEQS